jgi:hypothetical protein
MLNETARTIVPLLLSFNIEHSTFNIPSFKPDILARP